MYCVVRWGMLNGTQMKEAVNTYLRLCADEIIDSAGEYADDELELTSEQFQLFEELVQFEVRAWLAQPTDGTT